SNAVPTTPYPTIGPTSAPWVSRAGSRFASTSRASYRYAVLAVTPGSVKWPSNDEPAGQAIGWSATRTSGPHSYPQGGRNTANATAFRVQPNGQPRFRCPRLSVSCIAVPSYDGSKYAS